jgi:hypothetical protein
MAILPSPVSGVTIAGYMPSKVDWGTNNLLDRTVTVAHQRTANVIV